MFNDVFVEIVKGVDVGEKVILNPPRNLEPKIDTVPAKTVTAVAGE